MRVVAPASLSLANLIISQGRRAASIKEFLIVESNCCVVEHMSSRAYLGKTRRDELPVRAIPCGFCLRGCLRDYMYFGGVSTESKLYFLGKRHSFTGAGHQVVQEGTRRMSPSLFSIQRSPLGIDTALLQVHCLLFCIWLRRSSPPRPFSNNIVVALN